MINLPPVKVGDILVVQGITYAKPTVFSVEWIKAEARWLIHLDWGQYGTSKVYCSDINKLWYKWNNSN